MSKVVIIGAGKTGRGFLARLLREQELILIDRDAALIEALKGGEEAKRIADQIVIR